MEYMKVEYKTVEAYRDALKVDELNKIGKHGWILCGIAYTHEAFADDLLVYNFYRLVSK